MTSSTKEPEIIVNKARYPKDDVIIIWYIWDIFKLKNITNEKDKINKYPQIPIAIDMIKNKEIL